MEGLEITEYRGEDYKATVYFGAWRVAYLNYSERFDPDKIDTLERHMETDEVFVLLEGKATLLIGEDAEEVPMEKFKCYNVKKAVWHTIATSRDAHVLIVENADTADENIKKLELYYKEKGCLKNLFKHPFLIFD